MRETNRRALAAALALLAVVFSGCVMEPLDPGEEVIMDDPNEAEPPDENGKADPGKPGEPTPVPWGKQSEDPPDKDNGPGK